MPSMSGIEVAPFRWTVYGLAGSASLSTFRIVRLLVCGLYSNLEEFQVLRSVDPRCESPSKNMSDEIAAGTLDAGVLWGPVAGYYAKRAKTPLVVIPLVREHDAPMDFRISMAVRRSDQEWKRTLNKLIAENQSEINRILIDFGVPIVDEPGKSITP